VLSPTQQADMIKACAHKLQAVVVIVIVSPPPLSLSFRSDAHRLRAQPL